VIVFGVPIVAARLAGVRGDTVTETTVTVTVAPFLNTFVPKIGPWPLRDIATGAPFDCGTPQGMAPNAMSWLLTGTTPSPSATVTSA